MPMHDIAIPVLPSRSITATTAFYKQLGFEGGPHAFNTAYGILCRGDIELHFFLDDTLIPARSTAGCYVRVRDVETIYRAFSGAKLPPQGVPRIDALENKPWGLREFALVDPDGNLLRIGQVIDQ